MQRDLFVRLWDLKTREGLKGSPLGRPNSKILVQLMKNAHQITGQFKCHTVLLLNELLLLTQLEWIKLIKAGFQVL